jgi:purine-cytosine permease-like protein
MKEIVLDVLWFMIDNYEMFVLFILYFLVPLLAFVKLIRYLIDRSRKVRRLNNIVISEYSYKSFKQNAERVQESLRKRISTVLNTHHKINNRYWK